MIETNLALALGELIEEALQEYRLPTKTKNTMRPPRVFDGYLPPKRALDEEDFPFVIVRAEEGVSERGKTMVTIAFIIGCYSTETDGYAYCLEVMQRIRQVLCELPSQTLAKRYQLTFPMTWSNVPNQPYPQWQLEMTTKWIFNTPEMTQWE